VPFSGGSEHDTSSVLRALIEGFSDPDQVHPDYVEDVLEYAAGLLQARNGVTRRADRRRMPTQMFPRSAVVETPDPPPVPPAAL
jgi:hypothetical protein